jgi:hypothetical protein
MKEAPSSSETTGLTTATRRNIPEDDTLHTVLRSVILYASALFILFLYSELFIQQEDT